MSTITQRCQHCRKQIDESKLMLHEMYCERNCVRCDRCGLMYDQNDQESHDEEFHKSIECPNCHEGVPDLQTHQCPKKPTPCPYCKLDIPLNKFKEHEITCGSRTDKCDACGQYVKIKHLQNHQLTCPMKKIADPSKGFKEEFPSMQEVQQNQSQKNQYQRPEQQKYTRPEPFQQKQEIYNKYQQKPQTTEDVWKPNEVPKDQQQGVQGRQPQYKKQIFDDPQQLSNPVSNKQLPRFPEQQQPQPTNNNQGSQKYNYDNKYTDNTKVNNDRIFQSQALRSHQYQMPGKVEESLLNTQPQQSSQYKSRIPAYEPQTVKQNNNLNFSRPQEINRNPPNTFVQPPVQQQAPPKFSNIRNEDAHQPPKFQSKPQTQPIIQPPPPPPNQVPEEMVNDSMIARKIQAQMYAEDLGLSPEECEKQYDTQLNVFPNGNESSIYKHLMYKPEELAAPKPRNQQPQKPVRNVEPQLHEDFNFLSEEERLEQLRLYESIQSNQRRGK